MLDDYFIYNGIDSRDLGIKFQNQIAFSDAVPKYLEEIVPGRNGTLTKWEGNYDNITSSVNLYILSDDITASSVAVAELMREPGYHRLETSDDPDAFRMARITSGLSKQFRVGHLNAFSLTFDCKPQKYIKSGEDEIKVTTSGTVIHNPYFDSLPLITVYGTGAGTVTVGNYTVTILNVDSYVNLDCDVKDAYKGTTNCNGNISTSEFPKLVTGDNVIAFSGGVTSVSIEPRWWVL